MADRKGLEAAAGELATCSDLPDDVRTKARMVIGLYRDRVGLLAAASGRLLTADLG